MKSLLVLLCTSVLLSGSVFAADSDCNIISEEIIPLRTPNFDVPILWKRTMGTEGPDLPTDLISLADGGFVVIGDTAKYDKDKGVGPRQLYMARIDINGKIIWEKRNAVEGFVHASAGIAVRDRLAVLSGIESADKSKAVQLNFYDGLGALKGSKTITDRVYDLTPEGIVAGDGSKTLMIALWAENRKNPKDNFTMLKQLTLEGGELSSRQYLPGVPNHLESFKRLANGDFLGSGQIETNGLIAGWIFDVSSKGEVKFQRPYARGAKSNIHNVIDDGDGNFIAIGDSIPTTEGQRAAWIMKIDASGDPVWQKYVQGKYAFSGRDVAALKDGRILALVNARPTDADGGREHVRLMTFNAQGKMLGDEALIEGANAQGVNLMVRERSRVVSGITQSGLVDYSLASDQKAAAYDFWVVGLPKLSSYPDLCAGGKKADTFDQGL